MKKTTKVSGLLAVLGLLIIGAFIMPVVSAKDLGTVGSDLPVLLAGSQQNLTSVEFIVKGQDGSTIWSYRDAKICTQAVNDIKSGLTKAIAEMESHNVTVVQATVSRDCGEDRTSYDLNLATGKFEKLAEPIPSVKQTPVDVDNAASGSLTKIVPLIVGLIDTAGNGIPNGRSVTYYAHSHTNPTKTYRIMHTTAELHMYANGNWNSVPAQDGVTLSFVSQNDVDTSQPGLSPGSYRSEGQFSGVRDDWSTYSDADVIGSYFTIR